MEHPDNINVTGDISLEPYESVSHEEHSRGSGRFVVLILGPTGAGKSSFVEALAGPSQNMSLSSNQLAGYTQQISAFRLVNTNLLGGPLYLADTPGFADTQFSEREIMDMTRDWLKKEGILYLTPINGTRLAGTKRKTIEMLTAFLKGNNDSESGLQRLSFVTTMWDTLSSERAHRRAQSNFEQLCDKYLKEFIDHGAQIEKFTNTKYSAMKILNAGVVPNHSVPFTGLNYRSPQLYRDLHERIENALQEKRNIEEDLAQHEARTNPSLREILERNLNKNEEILAKFVRQFDDFGELPGLEDAAGRLRQEIDVTLKRPSRMRSMLEPEPQQPPPDLDSLLPEPKLVSTSITTPERHVPRTAVRDLPRRIWEEAKALREKWFTSKR
ncbi:hypothetical protein BJ165DRAFT_1440834 [Panaeolus papilionaceus]|nr:hypothetical protein BJ165DRAFT_1440834 [Panaeolus papilionaceus]